MPRLKNQHLLSATLICSLYILVASCGDSKDDKNLLMTVKTTDFEDVLTVDGTVQTVRSYSISYLEDADSKIVYLVESGTMVDSGQVVCVLESNSLMEDYDDVLTQIESNEAALNKTKADLALQFALLEAQVKNSDAQSALASLDSLQLLYASPRQKRLKELELERNAIEKKKLKQKLAALETINQSQLRKQELQLERLYVRLQTAKEKLERLTLVSPIAGLANRSLSWLTDETLQVGDQAYSGMPLITIPDLNQVKVSILASESQYKRIHVGDSVAFRFDAMSGNVAWGKIASVAPVGRPISRTNAVKVFEVEASVDHVDRVPKPGLSASCRIFMKRIPNVITIPQVAIYDVDSIKVVYVKHGKTFEERQVLLGESSPEQVVIVKGLTENEKLSLLKPSSSKVKKQTRIPIAVLKKHQHYMDSLRQADSNRAVIYQSGIETNTQQSVSYIQVISL